MTHLFSAVRSAAAASLALSLCLPCQVLAGTSSYGPGQALEEAGQAENERSVRETIRRENPDYLAYQEQEIAAQAKVYDLEHSEKYWNAHTNGQFIRVAGKYAAMDMAVHDIIFYEMAKQAGTSLSEQERDFVRNQKLDLWNDLEEEGQARLGVSEAEIGALFERMALAQKQQQIYADAQGVDLREYNMNGSRYAELLKEHTYEVNEKLWKRLNFGNITIE